jgi:Uma2 family endonuclease
MTVLDPVVTDRLPSSIHLIEASWPLRRLTVDQYHWLIERGFFTDDDRLELIDGYLVEMSPIHPPHAFAVGQLYQALIQTLGEQATVRAQQPITLPGQQSEPEPDLVIAKGLPQSYVKRHPKAVDIVLVCEVADATLSRDRNEKLRLYAQAGISEYWIVNLVDGVVEVYRDPRLLGMRTTYASRVEFAPGESITPLAFPDCQIDVSQIIPAQGSDTV